MKSDISTQISTNLEVPVEKVWAALTRPEQIKLYFFGTEAISDWKEGSSIVFRGEWQGKIYQDKGTILNIEPNKLLRYSYWSSMSGIEDKPENYLTITFKLLEEGDSTTLTITEENIPDEKVKAHAEANWNQVLADLKKLVEKGIVSYV